MSFAYVLPWSLGSYESRKKFFFTSPGKKCTITQVSRPTGRFDDDVVKMLEDVSHSWTMSRGSHRTGASGVVGVGAGMSSCKAQEGTGCWDGRQT